MTQPPDKKPSKKATIAERKAQLQSRLAQLEAREREARRKEDTRSRILLGGALLSRASTLVQQRDPKGASVLRLLRELVSGITRPADAAAKRAIEQLIAGMEGEMVKQPRLTEQSSLSASPKPAQMDQAHQAPLQPRPEPAQPSGLSQPSQMPRRPLHASTEHSQSQQGTWSKLTPPRT